MPVLRAATVSNNADSGPDSLRAAIATGGNIDFDPALAGATISLTSGPLVIGDSVDIDASALSGGIILDGLGSQRVIEISAGADSTVRLKGLHIQNGRVDFDPEFPASVQGAGIFASQAAILTIEDCTIRGCESFGNGGGLYLGSEVGSAAIRRCRLSGNSTGTAGAGGGIYAFETDDVNFSSCLISGNSSVNGGGVRLLGSNATFINCTIQGNSGDGVRSSSSSLPEFRNLIFWGNTGASGTAADQQLRNEGLSVSNLAYSLVQGASGSGSFSAPASIAWGAGNLNGTLPASNPKFVSGTDFRLQAGSPVLDQGDNSANSDSLDLAGRARVQNLTIDLGAFEGNYVNFATLFPTLNPNEDENGNGYTNLQEYGMGLDPTAANKFPAGLPVFSSSGESSFLTFRQRSNATDLTFPWKTSDDVSSWMDMVKGVHYEIASTTFLSSERDEIVLELILADPWRFYQQGFSIPD